MDKVILPTTLPETGLFGALAGAQILGGNTDLLDAMNTRLRLPTHNAAGQEIPVV